MDKPAEGASPAGSGRRSVALENKNGGCDIPTLIKSQYDHLGRTHRRIGDYVLNHADAVCFQSLKQTAAAAGTTEATVLKFCGQLGFTGFLHFKRELQGYVKQRMSPNETFSASLHAARQEPEIRRRIIETEKQSLDLTYSAATPERLDAFVSALCRAGRVFVVGHHISELIARSLALKLQRVGMESCLVDINNYYDVERAVVFAREGDLFVLISFPTYSPKVRSLAEYLGSAGIAMACITDRYSSPIAAHASAVLVCNSDHELFYNSVTAAVSLASMVGAALALAEPERAEACQKRKDDFYRAYREGAARYRTEQDDML